MRAEKPAAWEKTEKAGATALFEDPLRRSTTLGVVVLPVRIASLQQFGTLQQVSEKLLATEREKARGVARSHLPGVRCRHAAACGADPRRGRTASWRLPSCRRRSAEPPTGR